MNEQLARAGAAFGRRALGLAALLAVCGLGAAVADEPPADGDSRGRRTRGVLPTAANGES